MPFKCNHLYNSAGAAMLAMQQMPRARGWGRGASCIELYLLARTFRNSLMHSRGSQWVAVKVQLMTIYFLAVVFSVLL